MKTNFNFNFTFTKMNSGFTYLTCEGAVGDFGRYAYNTQYGEFYCEAYAMVSGTKVRVEKLGAPTEEAAQNLLITRAVSNLLALGRNIVKKGA